VFGYPLRSPPRKDRANKILWVSRRAVKPLSDLRIHAQRMAGRHRVGRPVTRVVAGRSRPVGGQSPGAGLLAATLRWSGRTDELDLQYAHRP
ncbi:MAG: hypothetical protein ACXWZZ_03190, partial [Solirubrobacteraceae bacterium]